MKSSVLLRVSLGPRIHMFPDLSLDKRHTLTGPPALGPSILKRDRK